MDKAAALGASLEYFEHRLQGDIDRRVAWPTESQDPDRADVLRSYQLEELKPQLDRMGFTCELLENPVAGGAPFLYAERLENAALHTVFTYGHGDVVRGYDDQWRPGLTPWKLVVEGDRWYGRGTADNKGQHTINLAALEQVIATRRGALGFNVKALFEMGEERGSPGMRELCQAQTQRFKADVFIASDGPRLSADQPTLFLGSRGTVLFRLGVALRDSGLHSGNWGGVMRNPAIILANALSSLVDRRGVIQVQALRPAAIPPSVKAALQRLDVSGDRLGRPLDENWGEPGLSAAERLFGWNTLEVLAYSAGNAQKPVNAIPPSAFAVCQLRFVVGTPWQELAAILRAHLDTAGFPEVDITVERGTPATRVDPDNDWVRFAVKAMQSVVDKDVAILPNLAGTLPNDIFSDVLGMPTLWVPHSYPGCAQHAPDEHMLASVAKEGMALMTSLFWELGNRPATTAAG
jgi:acetylornithine deacetylase/succinyl-diaminopimelate desuccinylase-like protein